MKKNCTKCGKEKKLSKFYKSKSGRLGVASKCKKCELMYGRSVDKVVNDDLPI